MLKILGSALEYLKKSAVQSASLIEGTFIPVGVLGAFGNPLYWYIWTYIFPQAYESFWLRMIGCLACIPIIFYRKFPSYFKRFIPFYWHVLVTFIMPFTFTFLLLMNGASPIYLICEAMMIIFIMLFVFGFWLMLLCIFTGSFLGYALFLYCGADAHPLNTFALLEATPLFIFALVAMTFFSRAYKIGMESKQRDLSAKERIATITALAGSIAHEMRNPLGQIKFSLDSIEHTLPPPSTHKGQRILHTEDIDSLYNHLAQGQSSIKRGLQIISMTLDEVNGKPLDPAGFEYLDAGNATQKAVEEYSYETEGERAKVRFVVLNDFTFKANETAYAFILFNLIKNALYYFKQHLKATMTVTVDEFRVTVRDTGPGIAPQALARLFEPFASSGKQGGTGLGLSYCKRTMQAFGGDITCASDPGLFTEFTLRFPVLDQDELAAHENEVLQSARQAFAGKRILIVDDQPMMRQSTRRMLDGLEAQLDEAENGVHAIEMLEKAQYALIIMDLNMPVMDGYASAEKIRQGAVPAQKFIPIVAYTSESAYIAHVKTQKVGMNGFVCKPCTRLALIKSLLNAITLAASKDESNFTVRLTGKTVLVADDEALNRNVLATYLRHWGASVLEAVNGSEVIHFFQRGAHVDAILMDMQMPSMNGAETSKSLRAASIRIPIIALTGNSSDEDRLEALEAGMNDFMSKPIDRDVLRTKLIAALAASTAKPATAPQPAPAALAAPAAKAAPQSPSGAPEGWTVEMLQARDATTPDGMPLINVRRLEDMRKMPKSFLTEYLIDYTTLIGQHIEKIEVHMANQNFEEFHNSLHKLLGNAGEAGAYALHQFLLHRIYPTVAKQHIWPTEENWFYTVKTLHTQTMDAINGSYLKKR